MSDDLRTELTDAAVKEIFPGLPPHRAWHRFGFRSPSALWSRAHSSHPWLTPHREIKYGLQRWRRGWSDRDIWGFDYFLAGVIADGVARLAEISHGMPMDMEHDEWLEILGEIEDGMRASIKIMDDYLDEGSFEYHEFERAMNNLKNHWFSLWD